MLRRIRQITHSYAGFAVPGAIRRINNPAVVCLTFDDGPHPEATPRILDVLEQLNVKATFFFNGSDCERHGEIVTECLALGHQIGNHGYRHTRHIGTHATVASSISETQNAIFNITSMKPAYFRPPYGYWLPIHADILRSQQLALVLWSCMPDDFLPRTQPVDISTYMHRSLRGGDIVVMHGNNKTAGRIEPLVRAACNAIHERGFVPGFIQ